MTPNDIVRIRPTSDGWAQITRYVDKFNKELLENRSCRFQMSIPQMDESGYIEGQFWCLMQYFDWSRGLGGELQFTDMKIKEHQG